MIEYWVIRQPSQGCKEKSLKLLSAQTQNTTQQRLINLETHKYVKNNNKVIHDNKLM